MDALLDLYAAQPFWVWAAIAAALLAVEVMTGSGWLLWASASAAVTGVATALAGLGTPAALLVFAATTITSTLLARRYLPKSVPAHDGDINDNVGRLIGRPAVVARAFENGRGRVFIDGKEWAAETDGAADPAAGVHVEVVSVEGASLRVRVT